MCTQDMFQIQSHRPAVPVSEGRSSGEEDGFGFGLWLIQQTEEGVMFHTVLPKNLALIPTGHEELQCVPVRTLKHQGEAEYSLKK